MLAMQPQADVLSSIEDGHSLQGLRPIQRCVAGQTWTWDGVRFDVLHPQAQDYELDKTPKPNALSCVLRISNAMQTVLLVGDIEAAQEARLVTHAVDNLQAHVLLVPHHGSKTSSSAAFLDAVSPRLALVQAGYRNRFGHPVASVMERYAERGIPVITSAHCGAALWRSDQPQGLACQRELEKRYWHHRVP